MRTMRHKKRNSGNRCKKFFFTNNSQFETKILRWTLYKKGGGLFTPKDKKPIYEHHQITL